MHKQLEKNMETEKKQQTLEKIDRFAHSRALVLQAIHHTEGMTYAQIRDWIKIHKDVVVEDVGRRCRDLYELKYAYKIESENRVHVYPGVLG